MTRFGDESKVELVFLVSNFEHADFEMLLKYPSEHVKKGVGKMGLDSFTSENWVEDRCL